MDIDLEELVLLDEQDFEPPELYPEDEDELELHQHQQPPQPDNSDQQLKKEQGLPKPSLAIPAKPITDPSTLPKTQFNGKKRFRSDDPNSRNSDAQDQSEDKRSRVHDPNSRNSYAQDQSEDKRSRVHEQETENDEDWIRYSPPPPPAVAEPVVVEEKIISRYASEIDGNFIPVTGLDGDRVYAKTCSVVEDRVKKLDFKTQWTGLISEPIHILLQKAEKEAFTKALQASVGSQSDSVMQETPLVNEDLWVKKYAPRSFRELLSDERTNREVLFWLKQWDSCVFGSEMKETTDDVLAALKRHSSVSQHQKHSNRSFQGRSRESRFGQGSFPVPNNLDQEMNNDSNHSQDIWKKKVKDSGPPEQKILLLCGSPGLGKTTLAHVAARHCGYRVVEINASDDRSTSTIERKIHDVVQMNSVLADSMPKCLVIDEIDGALGDGKGAVEVILKMLSADRKSDAAKQDVAKEKETGKPSSKKKQRGASLLRPVICICNDLYAPALRPLRQVAKVHIFVQPTVSRVVNRLKFICTKEGLKASSTALTTLAQYTECDIRSCLNTLQFLHKKKEAVNTLDISSQVVGTKDTPKSFFDIWKEIFQKRKEKHERKLSNGCSNAFNEFQSILSLISNRGDYDTVLDGVHENMLQLHYHDPVMRKTVKCLQSLGVSDMTHQYIMRSQKMSLQAYQPAIAITIRSLVAQNERPNIEWPKSFHRYRTGLMEKTDNLRSWHSKISPNVSRHLSTKSFVEDSISPLLHILSPRTLRPVAVYILSEKEKNDMAQLVDTMVSYSVTYKSLKSEPLTSTWRHEAVSDDPVLSFDPPIGDFIKFKGYTSDHFVLSAAVKQVLLHEVEKQNIIRGSMKNSMDPKYACEKANHTSSVEKNDTPQSSMLVSEPSCHNAKPTPNLKQSKPTSHVSSASGSTSLKLSSQKVEKKPSRGSFNYFERFKKLNSNGSQCVANQSKPATSERDSRPLLFKYNEGFTNAVKRPVRIRDFLV